MVCFLIELSILYEVILLSAQRSFIIRKGKKIKRKYLAIAIKTEYWTPGVNYSSRILLKLKDLIKDGDFIVISEKAISIAKNNLIDEQGILAGLKARLITKFWMRIFWGYLLSKICHMTNMSRIRLKNYPLNEGSAHKQICLNYTDLNQTLRHGSEGGIDASNTPYSYVCLPLENPQKEAEYLQKLLFTETGRNISLIINDTDKTYSFGRRNYTPLRTAFQGIRTKGGVIIYVLCRALRCVKRATPLGYSGENIELDILLDISEIGNRARGVGAGRTLWHMISRFGVTYTNVTWEMLESVDHYPIVIVRNLN